MPGSAVATSFTVRRLLLAALPLLAACGDDATSSGGLTLSVLVSRGGPPIPCAEAGGVDEVEIRVFAADGRLVPGYPQKIDCATGAFADPALADGDYDIDIRATGELSGDPEATLFSTREPVRAPGTYDVVLDPQVAFLTLSWTFGEDELAPCGTEVADVSVIVSAGAGQVGTYSEVFGCTDTPVTIPRPFDLQEYLIQVDANSSEGFPLFTHTAERLLDRGANAYTANLMPLGGQVFLDWAFRVLPDDMPVRMCDAESVQVDALEVTIESLEGGQPVSETVPCTAPMRPYAFTGARFTPGRQLALVVEAEGAETFYAREEFTMPAGDRVGDRLTLQAVGSATVAVAVQTASCAAARIDRVELEARLVDVEGGPTREVELAPEGGAATLDRLWYGTWEIEAQLATPDGPACPRLETRRVESRTNAWAPITF